MSDKAVGILGRSGGQLGRMLAVAASLLNVKVVILDVGDHGPAKQIVKPRSPEHSHIDGSFSDPVKIRELASKVDVLTVEIEHVDADALEEIQNAYPKLEIHPHPTTIKTIQDKFRQKEMLRSNSLPIAPSREVESNEPSIRAAIDELGLPLMVKSKTLAYDGRGNYVIRSLDQIPEAISALGLRPLYVEKWMPFTKEIAVMVIRTPQGEIKSYPVVETVHKESICHLVFAPFRGPDSKVSLKARSVAEAAVRCLSGAGVFGVEMFLMPDVMLPAARILDRFGIPYELTIVSAHRTPDRLVEYSRSAASRGLRVIIAGAGGAAHLPGMVAAMTPLPVVGVPVKGSSLDGVDSLHSIVQMPRGIPVATVAINNGMNAGLLAVRMLSTGLPALLSAMEEYMSSMESEVLGKVEKLKEVGWENYEVKRT
ncbi:hypothetical protein ONZ45_g4458 [Pleurotus djamor]|nr:hypothetical protein ONZ45_g4458 [Pleurotus djamor]